MKQTTLASFFKKPSTKAPEEPAKQKGPGAEVVGRRLKVWWPADEAWYAGGVASYDGERHAIQYDDGDEEAVDLSREKFEFLEGTHTPKETKRETKRPAPSSGLTAEQRADRERKRRKAQDSDDDFVVDDDASVSEEEEEEEVFDESDDDNISWDEFWASWTEDLEGDHHERHATVRWYGPATMLLLTVSISTSTSRSSARFLAMALSTAASDRFKLGNFVAIRLNRASAAGLESRASMMGPTTDRKGSCE